MTLAALSGRIVDVVEGTIYEGEVHFRNGFIEEIRKTKASNPHFIMPGLIDAHIHIESSLLTPCRFAELAVVHGTVATVSDPHEIANVLGVPGVKYMLDEAEKTPFKFFFGAPSCVPASPFETAGAVLGVKEVAELLEDPRVSYLAEVMNFPGVLAKDEILLGKIEAAKKLGLPIDGHAPGLRGENARRYIEAGPSSDHECTSYEEALERIQFGMKISIREGSAAKNFNALIDLLDEQAESIMFCSDDKHPDDLLLGHINQLVARAIKLGKRPMDAIRAATLNAVKHYNLPVGLMRPGDAADLIVVDSLESMNVQQTFISGSLVAERGKSKLSPTLQSAAVNHFNREPIGLSDVILRSPAKKIRAIGIVPGELLTREVIMDVARDGEFLKSDPLQDMLKLVVVNRYDPAARPAVAFVHGLGLKKGAIASSVAHDSHNIVAAGVKDEDIRRAVNLVIENKGGLSLACAEKKDILPLPVAGLMSLDDGHSVAAKYTQLSEGARHLGSTLPSPFMSLSFLALSVIPKLKLTDLGLFDGESFSFVKLGLK